MNVQRVILQCRHCRCVYRYLYSAVSHNNSTKLVEFIQMHKSGRYYRGSKFLLHIRGPVGTAVGGVRITF